VIDLMFSRFSFCPEVKDNEAVKAGCVNTCACVRACHLDAAENAKANGIDYNPKSCWLSAI
jgi:hypothetical protein